MSQQEIPGFKILMIRKVPWGSVLNAESADFYELIECGTWISDNRHWMIMTIGENEYMLHGNDTQVRYDGRTFIGPLETILKNYKEIPDEHK